jgi:serine/threonine protein kinase/Tol biopolymer transport system component
MTDFTGQDFDRYHILEPLGEGGMASVYKAYDTRLERDVAVKIIRTDMFIPATLQQVLKRFEREAKSLAKLSHPNIVSIIDYGEHDGIPFLVMEYLPGGTLKDRLVDQRMAWQESFHLLLPVARALQFSHQQGIIHRDVKPSNILITLSGEPMLSDFGIAKILESGRSTGLTGTGVGIGTPEYMAPEQWVGNTGPQTDIYSLGVVLYEMVTGRKPYVADTPTAILLKQASDPLPRPRQFTPELPASVEKILLKALAKKPENRYQTMEEFITSMEILLGGQARMRQPAVPFEKHKVEPTPHPEPAVPLEESRVEPVSPLEFAVSPEKPGMEPALPLEPVVVPAEVPGVDQATLIARVPTEEKPVAPALPLAASDLTTFPPPGTPAYPLEVPPTPQVEPAGRKMTLQLGMLLRRKVRNIPVWTIALVGLLVVAVVVALAVWGVHRQASPMVLYSASGANIYYTSDQTGRAEIWYLDAQAVSYRVTRTPGGGQSWSPALAANGFVYYTSNQSGRAEIWYLDAQAVSHRVTQTPGGHQSWSPMPAPDGNIYYTSDQSGNAEIWYLDGKAVSHQVTQTPGKGQSWSPVPRADGNIYYTSDQSGRAEIWYLDAKAVSHQVTRTPGGYQCWSPMLAANGVIYYVSDQSGKAEIWYLDAEAVSHRVTQTPGGRQSWAPVPVSGAIYYTSDQSGKAEIWYLDAEAVSHRVTQTPGGRRSWLLMYGKTPANTLP